MRVADCELDKFCYDRGSSIIAYYHQDHNLQARLFALALLSTLTTQPTHQQQSLCRQIQNWLSLISQPQYLSPQLLQNIPTQFSKFLDHDLITSLINHSLKQACLGKPVSNRLVEFAYIVLFKCLLGTKDFGGRDQQLIQRIGKIYGKEVMAVVEERFVPAGMQGGDLMIVRTKQTCKIAFQPTKIKPTKHPKVCADTQPRSIRFQSYEPPSTKPTKNTFILEHKDYQDIDHHYQNHTTNHLQFSQPQQESSIYDLLKPDLRTSTCQELRYQQLKPVKTARFFTPLQYRDEDAAYQRQYNRSYDKRKQPARHVRLQSRSRESLAQRDNESYNRPTIPSKNRAPRWNCEKRGKNYGHHFQNTNPNITKGPNPRTGTFYYPYACPAVRMR